MPNLPKNIAVVGCGYWGQNIVRSAADAGILAAVSDSDAARAAPFAEKYKIRSLSYEAVLADESIAGVMLAVPAPQHAEMALAAFAAGKHVFVEKPIALSVDDAQAMIDAGNKADRILMVGHLLHYHPAFIALKKMITSGMLGSIRHIYSNRLNFGKIRTEEDVFWSFAPHDVSMILALVGRMPLNVDAHYTADLMQSALASTAIAHFDFGQNLNAHIHVSWLNPFKEQKLVVVGDLGMVVFDDTLPWDQKLAVVKNHVAFKDAQPVLHKGQPTFVPVQASEPLRDECIHFARCIATGQTPDTDGIEALRVLRVMQACDKAAEVHS